jgi:predicted ATPase
MLNSILIENFKSYKSARLPLAPLTLMIGANASGKTNAIEAFRFLSWVVGGEKLSTIKNRINDSERIFRGDVRDLVYQGAESFTLGASVKLLDEELDINILFNLSDGLLTIQKEKLHSKTTSEDLYETRPYGGKKNTVSLFLNDAPSTLHLFHLIVPNDISAIHHAEVFQQKSDFNNENQHHTLYVQKIQKLISTISGAIFFDLIPSAMRGDSHPETQLRNTGANLAGVLYTLWQQDEQQAHILAFIQSLPEQDIKALKFYEDHRGRVELALIETFGSHEQEQHIELLSDGTLRVLAIAAALLSAPEGSTIVIEEVDNGVHPSRAKQLLTTMREHAERRGLRLLLSTHNPALMDALPDEALGDVVFCYRDPKEGDSRLVRLSDLDDYMGLVMQGSLGQLVTRGVVDRFVKNPVTPEEKKQKALDWLAMMQGDDE